MRKIGGVLRYTFIELFRNRVYYVLLLFAATLLLASLLLGSMGGEQRARMITDFGLAGIEMVSLVIAVFAAVTLVLQEMDSRTLYLILTRPVSRYQFILGRFFGLLAIITAAFVLMAASHIALLTLQQIPISHSYFISLYFSWQKIMVIAAVAMVFSLFSTSTVSAVTFTLFFWVMGHFSGEIAYLAQKASSSGLSFLCRFFYYVAPNFQAMNLKDFSSSAASAGWLWTVGGYGLTYTAACLAVTVLLFRRKEF